MSLWTGTFWSSGSRVPSNRPHSCTGKSFHNYVVEEKTVLSPSLNQLLGRNIKSWIILPISRLKTLDELEAQQQSIMGPDLEPSSINADRARFRRRAAARRPNPPAEDVRTLRRRSTWNEPYLLSESEEEEDDDDEEIFRNETAARLPEGTRAGLRSRNHSANGAVFWKDSSWSFWHGCASLSSSLWSWSWGFTLHLARI